MFSLRDLTFDSSDRLCEIDWTNPLSRGLLYARHPSLPLNLVNGRLNRGGITTNPYIVDLSVGGEIASSPSNGLPWCVPSDGANFAFFAPVRYFPWGSYATSQVAGWVYSNSTGFSLGHRYSSANLYARISGVYIEHPVSLKDGLVHFVGVNVVGGVTQVWKDGVLVASSTVSAAMSFINAYEHFFGGNGLLYDRPLSKAEIISLSSNRNVLLKPAQKRIWVPAAVSGGTIYTLSPGGTVSFTGTSPELREKMLAPSGSFVLSGFSGFLREHMYLPSGTVSFSGTAPISQAATYVLSISGSVVFSGSTEYQRTKVQSSSGTISFTGTYAPLHEKTYAPSGTISFSGAAAETRIRVLSPTGEITFLGSAPIINPNVPAGQGTWRTLTGMGQ